VARFTTEVEMEQIGERTRSRGQLEQDLGPRRVPGGAIVLVAGARFRLNHTPIEFVVAG
jgi:hypothetical protein